MPIGVRRLLSGHEVRTFPEMQWHPQMENGELLNAGEAADFDVIVTSDQNIEYQQNLSGRKLALVVLGSSWDSTSDLLRYRLLNIRPWRFLRLILDPLGQQC